MVVGSVGTRFVHCCCTARDLRIRWCMVKTLSSDRMVEYLKESLLMGQLTNDGPLQAVIRIKIKSFVKCAKEVIMACSGTAALHAWSQGFALERTNIYDG